MTLWALFIIALGLILVSGMAALLWGMTHPRRFSFADALATSTPTTPEEAGMQGEAVTFTLSDGHETPGFLVQGEKPDGPTIVALHGFGSGRYRCFVWMKPYLPFASQLVFYDQRGQGESQAPNCHGGTTEMDDLLKILEQLPKNTLANGVVLYGRSMGAGTVIGAGAQLRGDELTLHGVIAEGPYSRWHQPVWQLFKRKHWPHFAIIPPTRLLVMLLMPRLARMNRLQESSLLTCPLLVLHGTADDTCPLPLAEQIAEAAPDATLVTFEGGLHYGLWEDFPHKYEKAIEAFFQKLSLPKDAP